MNQNQLKQFICVLVLLALPVVCSPDARAAAVCDPIPGVSCRVNGAVAEYRRTIQNPQSAASAEWFQTHGISTFPWQRSVAVLVGISEYQNFSKLEFVRRNVAELRKFLLLEERFDEVDILQDGDVTQQTLENLMMNTIPTKVGMNDRFLFYYSGHGDDVKAGIGYMIFSRFPQTGFDAAQALDVGATKRWAQRITAKHALFLLDGCALGLGLESQSGNAGTKTPIQRLTDDPGRIVFAATRGAESTYGSNQGLSYFTEELLRALRDPKADPTGNGLIDIASIADIMNPRLAAYPLPVTATTEWYNKVPLRLLPATHRGSFFFLNTAFVARPDHVPIAAPGNVVRQDLSPPAVDSANSIAMEFVMIHPGEFIMGCSQGEGECFSGNVPAHRVWITKGFEMGKYEVTQGQWESIMGDNPSHFKGPSLPVENVSWNQAQEFLRNLNGRHDGYRYRLPTEAEWEYAAREGTMGIYYDPPLDSIAWYSDNSGGKTHPVGEKQPNALGLYDMLGNVSVMLADWMGEYEASPIKDPTGDSRGILRSVRGLSWNDSARQAHVWWRLGNWPVKPNITIGFRCVREAISVVSGPSTGIPSMPVNVRSNPTQIADRPSSVATMTSPVVVTDQFKYELIACTGIANSVTCQLRITNLGSDQRLKVFCGRPIGGMESVVRAIDNFGNDSWAEPCAIANSRMGAGLFPDQVQATLVTGVTVQATVVFSSISPAASSLALIGISQWPENSRRGSVTSFRNVPIAR